MGVKRCLACADAFEPTARVPAQNYCARPQCQRERRKLWQREKRAADNDYRSNQLKCQLRWREKHADYWQHYRDEHPDYVRRNRELQRARNTARNAGLIAKMNASAPAFPFSSGTYRLSAADPGEIAKMDAWVVRITVLSTA